MSSFEYVMVIVSIIMGLGITTLLRGTVHALRAESRWRPAPIHSLWALNLLVNHVGLWSLRWSGERREEWPFLVLVAFLLLPIVYYAQAELLFPRSGDEVDLTEYFLSNRRLFFGLNAFNGVAATVGPFIFYGGVNPIAPELAGPATFLAPAMYVLISAAFAFITDRRLHGLWAAASLVMIVTLFTVLTVG